MNKDSYYFSIDQTENQDIGKFQEQFNKDNPEIIVSKPISSSTLLLKKSKT